MAIVNYSDFRNNAHTTKVTMEGGETSQVITIFPNASTEFPGKDLALSVNYSDAAGAPGTYTDALYDATTGAITVNFAAATLDDVLVVQAVVVSQ